MPHKHIETSQTGFQGFAHKIYNHLKIHRLHESLPTDKSHYLMAAFSEFHVGEPIPGYYPGPVVVYIIEGELHVEDRSKPDEITKLVTGDVLQIDHESHITWSSPNKCRIFLTSYIPSDLHPEDLIIKN